MSFFKISDCSVFGSIAGSEYVVTVVGDPPCTVSVDCWSNVSPAEALPDAA